MKGGYTKRDSNRPQTHNRLSTTEEGEKIYIS